MPPSRDPVPHSGTSTAGYTASLDAPTTKSQHPNHHRGSPVCLQTLLIWETGPQPRGFYQWRARAIISNKQAFARSWSQAGQASPGRIRLRRKHRCSEANFSGAPIPRFRPPFPTLPPTPISHPRPNPVSLPDDNDISDGSLVTPHVDQLLLRSSSCVCIESSAYKDRRPSVDSPEDPPFSPLSRQAADDRTSNGAESSFLSLYSSLSSPRRYLCLVSTQATVRCIRAEPQTRQSDTPAPRQRPAQLKRLPPLAPSSLRPL